MNAVEETLTDEGICGVALKTLETFPDHRGFFRELVRNTDAFFQEGFGQWSHSMMTKDTVKAWHFHHLQIDWWYVPVGVITTVLFDNREESPTYRKKLEFKLGDPTVDPTALSVVVRIPQGVVHGCRVLSETAHLFYITSRTYDPKDEGRLPFNSAVVPHHWGDERSLQISERDRRELIPPYPRLPVTASAGKQL